MKTFRTNIYFKQFLIFTALMSLFLTALPFSFAGSEDCRTRLGGEYVPYGPQTVLVSNNAQKQLKKIPNYIVAKLQNWVESIELDGLYNARKIPGIHDEPLHGSRQGQHSVRLNGAYRAFYTVESGTEGDYIYVIEVNHHEY